MREQSGLDKLISQSARSSPWLKEVRRFGIALVGGAGDRLPDTDMENFARKAHEAYVSMRKVQNEKTSSGQPMPEDPALQPWDELSEDFRESSHQQADHIFIKLRGIGCEAAAQSDPRPDGAQCVLDNLELLAELEHRRFIAERTVAGWTYAPGPKDLARRTNPTLVDWDKLEERIKDYDREAVRSTSERLAGVRM